LTVKGQAPENTLLHGQVQIRIRQHNPGIFGFQAKNAPESMGFGVLLLEDVSYAAGTDERQNINSARCHQRADNALSVSIDDIHYARRKGIAKGFQQWLMQQDAKFGRLENNCVSHD